MFWLKRSCAKINLSKPLQLNKNQMLQGSKNDLALWTLISTCSYRLWIKYLMISKLTAGWIRPCEWNKEKHGKRSNLQFRGISTTAQQCSKHSTTSFLSSVIHSIPVGLEWMFYTSMIKLGHWKAYLIICINNSIWQQFTVKNSIFKNILSV